MYYFVAIALGFFFLNACDKTALKHPADPKVEELLSVMSLEEKVGQMTMICLSEVTTNRDKSLDLDTSFFRRMIDDYHIGSFLSATGSAREWYHFIRKAQEINMQESEIPLLFGIDHIHGANYVDEGTFFPHNLTLSCSFDTALMAEVAGVTAAETANLGLLWNFAPVLDLGRNAYWPRLYETFGEDPYLVSRLGSAYVLAYQSKESQSGHFSAACAKHFIGYSDPRSGFDRSPAEIPDQVLYELFLPSFKQAVDAGVRTVMLNSGEVNGVPVHISDRLVTGLLRDELGFEGVVITDIKDILKLTEMHRAFRTLEEAVVASVNAGIDISMSCNDTEFFRIVLEKVKEGVISEDRIDQSVRRILKLKSDLGLLKDAYPGYTSEEEILTGDPGHQSLALRAAENSMVLLKNRDGILPLDSETNILVAGIAANSRRMLNGAWTLEWLGAEEERQPREMKVLHDALVDHFGASRIRMACETDYEGCGEDFLRKASGSDVILLTLGELPYSEFKGNIPDLNLDERCREITELALSTGKPVILVLVTGRPRLLNSYAAEASAILFAGYPGMKGAEALVNIISGVTNPSGKLSFSYPSDPGNLANYYRKTTQDYQPLYPFGFGLSYTQFDYSGLSLSDTVITSGDKLVVEFSIKNRGDRKGDEVILVYLSDRYGRITRPVEKLVRFGRIGLGPGEERRVKFTLDPETDFSYPDKEGKQILEPGEFVVRIGDLSASLLFKKKE